ncbi:MAG TPA: hypothetical protein PLG15_06660, partial [Candidatus Gastranaerophilaceae bacterium]|nr:hypothetical protein [Candidatus Gastranaerophilaceae bacterium]
TGGFSPVSNSINYDNGVLKMNKAKQLDMLAHELKHSEQFSSMIRTEGVGIEKLAEALAENAVKNSISESSFDFFFRGAYQNAVREGKAEEFLAAAKKNTAKTFLEEFRVNYEKVLNLPKISSDSIEGIKALEQINAIKDYEGANFIGIAGDTYKNNPLEVEAYAFGEKISNYFEKFMKYQKYYKPSVQ